MEKLRHLHGTRDLTPATWRPLKAATDQLRETFSSYGYQVLETPVLEPTELFLRKSGGELATRMYSFSDPGGNHVSLRPEYTASIIRHFLEEGLTATALPLRVQYAGPVFRYEKDATAYRQFTQMGAEVLGVAGPRADAEILSLSCTALSGLGLTGHQLAIGDVGVLYRLLGPLSLSERAVEFILGSVTGLKAGEGALDAALEKAVQIRLLASDPRHSYLSVALGGMEEEESRELLHGLLQWAEVGSLGQRQPSQVVERLLRKLKGTDEPDRLRRGLEMAYNLAGVAGEPGAALAEAGKVIESSGMDTSVLDRLRETMAILDLTQTDGAAVVLDFGLARGLAYYTGTVFEIVHPSLEHSLGGGGRYDSLARALGGPSNTPALGFAYTLEHIVEVLDAQGNQRGLDGAGGSVLVSASSDEAYREALRLAGELREKGMVAEVEVCGMSVEESLSYARARNISEVITVEADGQRSSHLIQAAPSGSRRER